VREQIDSTLNERERERELLRDFISVLAGKSKTVKRKSVTSKNDGFGGIFIGILGPEFQ
jgi:hypothetical protein